jgi:sugar (pentulose or hexulose) kinase
MDAQGPVALGDLRPSERATLAAFYCAQVTSWLINRLGGAAPVVVEGPFARNPVYTGTLAALCAPAVVQVSTDELEGTARGAWMLTHWTEPAIAEPATADVVAAETAGLHELHQRWLAKLPVGETTASEVVRR